MGGKRGAVDIPAFKRHIDLAQSLYTVNMDVDGAALPCPHPYLPDEAGNVVYRAGFVVHGHDCGKGRRLSPALQFRQGLFQRWYGDAAILPNGDFACFKAVPL